MVEVYFESTKDGVNSDGGYATLVAIFDDEETYAVCTAALEEHAKKHNMVVTESVKDEIDIDDLI